MFKREEHGCQRMEGGRLYSCALKGSCLEQLSLIIRNWEEQASHWRTGSKLPIYTKMMNSRNNWWNYWSPHWSAKNFHVCEMRKKKKINLCERDLGNNWGLLFFLIAFLDLIQGNVIVYFDLSNGMSILDWNLWAKLYRKVGKSIRMPSPKMC